MPSSGRRDRDFTESLIGPAAIMSEIQLPTVGDILRACSMRRKQLKTGSQEPKWTDIRNYVAKKVMGIWGKASLPYKSDKRVFSMIDSYHNTLVKLRKVPSKHKGTHLYQDKMRAFVDQCNRLCDIGYCHCEAQCCCPLAKRVPKDEVRFIRDQRSSRKMYIGGIDKKKISIESHKFRIQKNG